MLPSSSGQDAALSWLKHEFDSRWERQLRRRPAGSAHTRHAPHGRLSGGAAFPHHPLHEGRCDMEQIAGLIAQFGLLAVFLTVLLDEGGLPLPSWPLLAAAGAMAFTGSVSLPMVIAAAVGGAIVADNLWYWIARLYGRRVLALLCKMSLSPDSCVRQTESVFSRVGPAALLFAKFVPGLGNITVALSGITRLPMRASLALASARPASSARSSKSNCGARIVASILVRPPRFSTVARACSRERPIDPLRRSMCQSSPARRTSP